MAVTITRALDEWLPPPKGQKRLDVSDDYNPNKEPDNLKVWQELKRTTTQSYKKWLRTYRQRTPLWKRRKYQVARLSKRERWMVKRRVAPLTTYIPWNDHEVLDFLKEVLGVPTYAIVSQGITLWLKAHQPSLDVKDLDEELAEIVEARRVSGVETRIRRLRYIAHAKQDAKSRRSGTYRPRRKR